MGIGWRLFWGVVGGVLASVVVIAADFEFNAVTIAAIAGFAVVVAAVGPALLDVLSV